MPAQSRKEVTFFLLGTGPHPADGDPQYFEEAKKIIVHTLQKKIVTSLPDEVAVVLGVSGQGLDTPASCTIAHLTQQVPSWAAVEHIKKLENRYEGSFHDWFGALDTTVNSIESIANATKRILVLAFDCHPTSLGIDKAKVEDLVKRITRLDIILLWVGSKRLDSRSKDELGTNEKLLKDLVKRVKGEYMTFQEVLQRVSVYNSPATGAVRWPSNLEIGDIKIPIAMYVVATAPFKKPTLKMTRIVHNDKGEEIIVAKHKPLYLDKLKNPCALEDMTMAYMYGGQCIPVTEEDKVGMLWKPEPKSIKLHGFVSRESVQMEDICGDTSRIIVPDTESSAAYFYSLVRVMDARKVVAVVRRLYGANGIPKIGLCFPQLDSGKPRGLIFLETPYSEDRRVQVTRPINPVKSDSSNEQKETVRHLIDSMMSPTTSRPEILVPGKFANPDLQHLYQCIVTRATNPDDRLPEKERYLNNLIEQPSQSIDKERRQALMENIKRLFSIPPAVDGIDIADPNLPTLNLAKQVEDETNEEVLTETEPPINESATVWDDMFD